MPLRAACLQLRLAPTLSQAETRALDLAREARERGAELALLPEYWFVPAGAQPLEALPRELDGARDAVQRVSAATGLCLAGNAPERADGALWNTLFVFDAGRLVGQQRKLHPMPREELWGIAAARDLAVFEGRGARLGGLVCADVLHPEAARILALHGAEVVLNPVMSWLKPNDKTKDARRAMFVARAYDNACFVLKAGSVGATGGPNPLVGRSLITAPWGVVAEAKDELGEEVLVADLDLARVREERRRSLSLGRRHPEAYGPLVEPRTAPASGQAPPHDFDV